MLGATPDGTMTELGFEADVLNPFSSAIAGDTYIVVSVCQEVLVAVAEDCGEWPSSIVRVAHAVALR